ncbi:gene 11-1 protein [Burkholderia pseudomallei]|nr:gene 11-1 protein [Burkholderia pseudomallei]
MLLRPVESDATLLFVLLRPVDSEATLLLVVLSPLEREVIELLADESPVDVEVDSDVRLLLVVLKAGGKRADAGRG